MELINDDRFRNGETVMPEKIEIATEENEVAKNQVLLAARS